MPDGLHALHTCRAVDAMHALQVIVTLDRNDLTLRSHFDRRILFDAADEVARHAVGKLALPHHHDDPVGPIGQVDGGLPGRVTGANDHDRFPFAELRFHRRREVVDPGAVELRQIFDRQPAVFRPGGDDDRSRADPRAVVDLDGEWSLVATNAHCGFGDQQLRAEFLRLRERTCGELLTGDAGRKSEVVFDAHAGAGLTARLVRFDHQHVETFRRRVHRGAKSGWSRTDDHNITYVALIDIDRVIEAETVGDFGVRR